MRNTKAVHQRPASLGTPLSDLAHFRLEALMDSNIFKAKPWAFAETLDSMNHYAVLKTGRKLTYSSRIDHSVVAVVISQRDLLSPPLNIFRE